ncbi:hypothetical protein BGZ57DRAFT_944455 [Hyaloscypha finlandica]|nr:hypothetical protein BGZ57DRAFT_944455 [Hyaloscypha finlandica]
MDLDPRSVSCADVEDAGQKSDSDAETIVLPGKHGHSPSRVRKSIKHEDKSEDEVMTDAPDIKDLVERDEDAASAARAEKATIATSLGKRKRTKNGTSKDDSAHLGNSSGLSSVPTSPVTTTRSSLSKPAASDSDLSKSPSPPARPTIRDKAKSADRVLPRRKQYASGSGDEDEADAESQGFGRQRSSGADHKANRDGRSSSKLQVDNTSRKRTRSISPHPRGHRRSISTQLPSKSSHGLSHKKKRVPAPLQSTEYHSDDSSASGNSHPRSSRLRNLAAPTTGESAISPAKMPPHKKHVNSSGQTLLAIACSRGKLDIVKQRYEERPEDVNLADNALNTPLHIASLEGFVDIVQFLINTGSYTPLHDAVDNKNVEVVKLLLDAGANPSLANTEGNEPLDKISVYGEGDDDDDGDDDEDDEDSKEDREKAGEMRAAIMAAKQKFTSTARRGSEDQMHENSESRLSHPKESPRQTPPAFETQTSMGRMGGTARRIKTSNSHLWMTANPATLQKAASEGDVGAITLFNAARDPAPLEDKHLEVIKLFLAQREAYYEIAKRKEAFDNYQKTHKSSPSKLRSPGLRRDARDTDPPSHKRSASSPKSKEVESNKNGQPLGKRGPGRPRKEENIAMTLSDQSDPMVKPRRKLRRASIASNASSVSIKDKHGKSSPNIPRLSKSSTSGVEKDRARSLKRDDSKDRLNAIRGESPVKRPRKSETPPRSNMQEVTAAYGSDAEAATGQKAENTPNSSPEHRTALAKTALSRENTSGKLNAESKAKSARPDLNGSDKASSSLSDPSQRKPKHSSDRAPKEPSDTQSAQIKIEEEDAQRQAQLRREKKEAEAAQKERIEVARQARLAREQAAREEEEKRQREETERKERQQREDAEAHSRAMEEQRILYLEQERLKREELERRRAAALEQQRIERARIEKERREERLAKLPLLLKWFDQASDPQTPEIASLFKRIAGYRYDTIKPETTGQAIGREQWMLNLHVAILLGEKDLQLSRYTAWERIQLSHEQKRGVWGTENGMILLKDNLSILRKQVPSQREPAHEVFKKNETLFLGLDLFVVKISEFMFIVPRFPHLRGVELQVKYMELRIPQTVGTPAMPFIENKWKRDPNTPVGQPFAPQPRLYVNGEFIKEAEPQKTRLLKEPPPLDRFPRRYGITRVYPGEPDYEEVCRKQGLLDLIPGYQASPTSSAHPNNGEDHTNGITPPRSDKSKSVNGGSPHLGSISHQLPNGTSKTSPPPNAPG